MTSPLMTGWSKITRSGSAVRMVNFSTRAESLSCATFSHDASQALATITRHRLRSNREVINVIFKIVSVMGPAAGIRIVHGQLHNRQNRSKVPTVPCKNNLAGPNFNEPGICHHERGHLSRIESGRFCDWDVCFDGPVKKYPPDGGYLLLMLGYSTSRRVTRQRCMSHTTSQLTAKAPQAISAMRTSAGRPGIRCTRS